MLMIWAILIVLVLMLATSLAIRHGFYHNSLMRVFFVLVLCGLLPLLLQVVVAQAIVVMKTAVVVVVVEVEGVSAEFSAGPSEAQTDSKKSTSGRWASEELSQRGAPPISTTSLPRP